MTAWIDKPGIAPLEFEEITGAVELWGRGTNRVIEECKRYGIASVVSGGQTHDFDCDIVYANGAFFQWPSGTQT